MNSRLNKKKTIFITGTDTGVGKTFISCGILEAANKKGFSTAAIKPVAAGARKTEEGLRNDDALALMERVSIALNYQQINPVCFEAAISPHLAAHRMGRKVSVSQLVGFCRGVMMQNADLTIIEGAGGWKVPVNDREFLSSLVKELNLPVILVVAMRLGCINHALLSAQSIAGDGVKLAGWIANQLEPDMLCFNENFNSLKTLLGAPCLAEIPFQINFKQSSSCAEQIEIESFLEV